MLNCFKCYRWGFSLRWELTGELVPPLWSLDSKQSWFCWAVAGCPGSKGLASGLAQVRIWFDHVLDEGRAWAILRTAHTDTSAFDFIHSYCYWWLSWSVFFAFSTALNWALPVLDPIAILTKLSPYIAAHKDAGCIVNIRSWWYILFPAGTFDEIIFSNVSVRIFKQWDDAAAIAGHQCLVSEGETHFHYSVRCSPLLLPHWKF